MKIIRCLLAAFLLTSASAQKSEEAPLPETVELTQLLREGYTVRAFSRSDFKTLFDLSDKKLSTCIENGNTVVQVVGYLWGCVNEPFEYVQGEITPQTALKGVIIVVIKRD